MISSEEKAKQYSFAHEIVIFYTFLLLDYRDEAEEELQAKFLISIQSYGTVPSTKDICHYFTAMHDGLECER